MNRKEAKKRKIIKSSIDFMHLHGYNGTSVKDLTDAAGIPKGSFYNYFENKEDYAKEALYYLYREESKENFGIFEDESIKPLDRIRIFYRKLMNDCEGPGFKTGSFVGNLTQEMGGVSDIISRVTEEIYLEITMRIYSCFKEAAEAGEFKHSIKIETLSNFLVCSWQGTLLRTRSHRDRKILDDFYEVLNEVLLS